MKRYQPRGSGKCAKAHVVATLVTKDGEQFQSSNFCLTPQPECPRDFHGYKSGEGYHLCKEICNQPAHAEENVIFFAKKQGCDLRGATIYVDYTWICENCKRISEEAGVSLEIGKPPTCAHTQCATSVLGALTNTGWRCVDCNNPV